MKKNGEKAKTFNEQEFLERLRKGDPEALNVFVEEYGKRILHTAYRMCGQKELALDTAQDTLALAIEHLNSFRGESKMMTWLYRILFNQCLKEKKKASQYQPFLSEIHKFDPEDIQYQYRITFGTGEDSPVEESLSAQEMRKVLWDALQKLPPHFRQIILLRDVEGLSVRDVSRILNLTETNVKVRHHRARKKLREILKKEVVRPGPSKE